MTIPSPSIVRQTLSPKIKGIISSYPSVIRVPIAWGEMDMFGHLNNIWHARYAETARMTHINQIIKPLMTPNEYKNLEAGNGKGIIVKSNFIDYKFPTTYPDNLILATKMGKLQKDRFSQLTLLVSEKHDRVIAKCETVVVSFNHSTLQKEPLPAFYQDAYEKCTKEFGLQDEWETSKI